jgi:hypothetical protein
MAGAVKAHCGERLVQVMIVGMTIHRGSRVVSLIVLES